MGNCKGMLAYPKGVPCGSNTRAKDRLREPTRRRPRLRRGPAGRKQLRPRRPSLGWRQIAGPHRTHISKRCPAPTPTVQEQEVEIAGRRSISGPS